MSVATVNQREIPAALPDLESETEREELLKQAAAASQPSGDDPLVETEGDETDETVAVAAKPSKKKLFLAFVLFVFGFLLLLAALCWFFGIGVFAQAKPDRLDRTPKTNQSAAAPATEDEKLKMALNLVAEKNPAGQNEPVLVESDTSGNSIGDSSVNVPSAKVTDLNEPIVVPDALPPATRNSASVSPPTSSVEASQPQNSVVSIGNQNSPNGGRIISASDNSKSETAPLGRSLFFGVRQKEKPMTALLSPTNNQTGFQVESGGNSMKAATAIPFGTLLPIRFLGAVYTLRASGGLVRMELTRAVTGKNYSFPAGTVLVGTLRGSEYKRAFVSIVGLIDPKSGGLVKFEGEVMGSDGASGVTGRRRKVKSAWSRVLAGLRDVGASAVNVIGSRRSGGTVVISDSTTKASGVLSQELGGLTRGGDSGEFVEISAGTNAYILVTDLPDEVSEDNRLAQNSKSATGLTDDELANLFSDGSPAKIRAALPRMTPQFRRLAEQVLAAEGNE